MGDAATGAGNEDWRTPASATVKLTFDRGTLRLVGQPSETLGASLADLSWDDRTECYRAPPWRYPAIAAALRRAGVSDEVPAYDRIERGGWATVGLRPYQRAALCAWEAAGRRGVVALPTGSGKTRVALAAMAMTGSATLCLVPTRVLMHQWQAAIAELYAGPIGCWGDGVRERAAITVITFESAYRQMARLGRSYELLVVDEAHHFGAGVRDEALEMSIAPLRLGLTATPPTDPAAAARLAELVGPTVLRASVGELAGRYLADLDVVVRHLALDDDERVAYRREMSVFRPAYAAFRRVVPGGSWADFVAECAQSREGRAALSAWRRARQLTAFTRGKARALASLLARHHDSRVLVFAADNATVYAIARRHLLMPLTCDIKRGERDEVLARFRRGELRALVSARVLNEGVDVPDADVAIVVSGTQGEREHVQRVGRLLRPAPGKRARVYELVAGGTSETRQAQARRHGLGITAIGGLESRGVLGEPC
jgi:superfamily II DNA or RNA helicase